MKPGQIICVGMGRVGLTLGLELAKEGHLVSGVDKNNALIELLSTKKAPFFEPELKTILKKTNMKFRNKLPDVFENHQIIFICVGTPMKANGGVNCRDVISVTKEVSEKIQNSPGTQYLVLKSTVPVGTYEKKLFPLFPKNFFKKNYFFHHPEFMREGSCFKDLRQPHPNIIGSNSKTLKKAVKARLSILPLFNEVKVVEIKTSEMIKYMNNSFHALKVVFANEIASFSNTRGINVDELFELFLSDKRLNISEAYLRPGFSFGGSCLSKEVKALNSRLEKIKMPLIDSILDSNKQNTERLLKKIRSLTGQKILICGITFKPNTDDLRESPLFEIAKRLKKDSRNKVTILDSEIVLEKIKGFDQIKRLNNDHYDLIVLGPYKIQLRELTPYLKKKTKIIDLRWHPHYKKISSHPNYLGEY